MNVTILSAFRNASRFIDRYADQVAQLGRALAARGDTLYLVWAEGDSTDGSRAQLGQALDRVGVPGVMIDASHGGSAYGSVVKADRFRQLAHVGRCIWAALPATADVVVYVEADLIWQAATMMALIDQLAAYPAISPMIMLDRDGWPENSFYDTFIFRKDGIHFGHHPPYHACYVADKPFMVDSAGSCMAFRGDIARHLVFGEDTIFLGMCEQIYTMGGSVWVAPGLICLHQ